MTYRPCKQSLCTNCGGRGGYYWEAPVYHNERQTEWSSCHACVPDRHWKSEVGEKFVEGLKKAGLL